ADRVLLRVMDVVEGTSRLDVHLERETTDVREPRKHMLPRSRSKAELDDACVGRNRLTAWASLGQLGSWFAGWNVLLLWWMGKGVRVRHKRPERNARKGCLPGWVISKEFGLGRIWA